MSEKNGTPAVKPGAGNGTPAVKPTVEELRAEIKQTRAELGETVQALAARADVKARAMEQVEQTKQRVRVAAAAAGERVLSPLRGGGVAVGRQVRAAAGQAADKVPLDGAAGRVRTGQVPVALLFAGALAVVGVVLVVRGRRR